MSQNAPVAQQVKTAPVAVNPPRRGLLQRKCTCGGETRASGECVECKNKKLLQRKSMPRKVIDIHSSAQRTDPIEASSAPTLPNGLAIGGGVALEPTVRSQMESQFNFDFSKVRIHSDAKGAEASRKISARAFTYGSNIGFAPGEYAPFKASGRWLLAHELAHVVQQSSGVVTEQSLGTDEGPLEAQADAAANAVTCGQRIPALGRTGVGVLKFALCRHLLDAGSQEWVPEASVRNALISQLGSSPPTEREFPIPGGSAAPLRTDSRRRPTVIDPQVIAPGGIGSADIARLNGSVLELIEVKRATWDSDGVLFAENQMAGYVSSANGNLPEVNRSWQNRTAHNQTVSSVAAMPTTRFAPTSPRRVPGVSSPVSIAWCADGIMSFKAIGDRDPETFLCNVSDRGRIDAFLDRVMDRAHAKVEDVIRNQIEGPATRAVSRSTLSQGLRFILNRPEIRQFVPPGLSDERVINLLLNELQPYEALIRAKVTEIVQRAIVELRRMLQAQIRNLLQTSFSALCATAAAMTASELLNEFERRVRDAAIQLMPIAVMVAAQAVLSAMTAELALIMLEALAYVAAAVVIAIAAFLLWEVVAAIVAAGAAIEATLLAAGEFIALVMGGLRFVRP